jgi:hypothetical protein
MRVVQRRSRVAVIQLIPFVLRIAYWVLDQPP